MKLIFCFIIFASAFKAFANCELMTRRFHTIATYSFPEKSGLKAMSVFSREGGILFSSDIREAMNKGDYLVKVKDQFGILKNQSVSVSLEGATMKNYSSVRGQLTFLKTKDFVKTAMSEPIAILDGIKRTISLTGDRYFPGEVVLRNKTDALPGNLSGVLKSAMGQNDFTLVSEVKDYKNGISEEWQSQKLGEGNWELVQVKTKFSLPKEIDWKGRWGDEEKSTIKVNVIAGWLAFLTQNGKDFWYVGNSSGDPCGKDLKYEISGNIQNGLATIGMPLTLNYGLRYNDGSSEKIVYSLGDSDIVYYLNFGKDMIVVFNEGYR